MGYTRKSFARSDEKGLDEDGIDYVVEMWEYSLQRQLRCVARYPIFHLSDEETGMHMCAYMCGCVYLYVYWHSWCLECGSIACRDS